jgi:hypothetical protein
LLSGADARVLDRCFRAVKRLGGDAPVYVAAGDAMFAPSGRGKHRIRTRCTIGHDEASREANVNVYWRQPCETSRRVSHDDDGLCVGGKASQSSASRQCTKRGKRLSEGSQAESILRNKLEAYWLPRVSCRDLNAVLVGWGIRAESSVSGGRGSISAE